jgi:DnaK suppressor protein
MTMCKEKLEKLKTELLARRESIAVGLRRSTEEWIDSDDLIQADSVDQASADTDRGIAVQMRNRDRVIQREVDQALRRIENGTFGECERCGDEISEPRLKANPSTTLCINCKAALESEGQRFSGR